MTAGDINVMQHYSCDVAHWHVSRCAAIGRAFVDAIRSACGRGLQGGNHLQNCIGTGGGVGLSILCRVVGGGE